MCAQNNKLIDLQRIINNVSKLKLHLNLRFNINFQCTVHKTNIVTYVPQIYLHFPGALLREK